MNTELNQKYYALAKKAAKGLAALAESRYVLLIGSVVDGTADEYSDIDLLVLYNNEPPEEDIAKSLNMESVFKFRFDPFHFHAHYRMDGMQNAVLFSPADRIARFVGAYPDVSFDDYAEVSRYVVNGDLLHGDREEFSAWQERCRRVPEEMKKTTIHKAMSSLRFYFKQDRMLQLAERADWIMVNRTISGAVLEILKIVYLLNDQIMIKPKRTRYVLESFAIKPDNLLTRLENLFLLKNTLSDVRAKVAEVAAIWDELEQLTQEMFPKATG